MTMTAHMDGITSAGKQASRLTRFARKSAILGSTAVALSFAASAAQAQCTFAGAPIGNASGTSLLAASTQNSILSTITSLNIAFQTQTSAFIGSPPNPGPDQLGGGTWVRGIGGRTDKSAGTTGTFSFGTPATSGTLDCQTTSRTDFAGFQVGQDIARLNLGNSGWSAHLGVTGGYAETEGKTLQNESRFEVPFVGVYGALTSTSGLYVDSQARWDFYQMNLSDPVNGLAQQKFHGQGFSIALNAGYNIRLGNNFFVEPSAGVVHSRTQLDNLALNSFALGGGVGAIRVPGTMQFNDIESTLGRAGVRVGTSFAAGGMTLTPYGVASVFHEFAGNTSSTYTSLCVASGNCTVTPGPEFTQTFATSRVGTFGQYSLGIASQVTNTGWLGYARVDLRKGENIEGVSLNGGLRYQFSPVSRGAIAAKF
jgi:hypothetical protein